MTAQTWYGVYTATVHQHLYQSAITYNVYLIRKVNLFVAGVASVTPSIPNSLCATLARSVPASGIRISNVVLSICCEWECDAVSAKWKRCIAAVSYQYQFIGWASARLNIYFYTKCTKTYAANREMAKHRVIIAVKPSELIKAGHWNCFVIFVLLRNAYWRRGKNGRIYLCNWIMRRYVLIYTQHVTHAHSGTICACHAKSWAHSFVH